MLIAGSRTLVHLVADNAGPPTLIILPAIATASNTPTIVATAAIVLGRVLSSILTKKTE